MSINQADVPNMMATYYLNSLYLSINCPHEIMGHLAHMFDKIPIKTLESIVCAFFIAHLCSIHLHIRTNQPLKQLITPQGYTPMLRELTKFINGCFNIWGQLYRKWCSTINKIIFWEMLLQRGEMDIKRSYTSQCPWIDQFWEMC